MKKATFILSLIIMVAALLPSCVSQPFACFSTSVPADSMHVNQAVTFDGSCSSSANEFYWEFRTAKDTFNSFNLTVTHTFTDTGSIYVELNAVNSPKSAFTFQNFRIQP